MSEVLATVVIATRNRRVELRAAILSALCQHGTPEVIVMDDASDDGTAEMVTADFPTVRMLRSPEPIGYIAQRNRAAGLANGKFIFSIDDDATFSSPTIVERTIAEFADPRVGAVAIPFINVSHDSVIHQRAPAATGAWVCAQYIGTAHAVRREIFLALGGYRTSLIHQGEESDFCLRMLDAGYVCSLGRSDPIHHFESPKRDWARVAFYARRNDVLFALHNVPMPMLIAHLAGTTVIGLVFIWNHRRDRPVLAGLRGLICGYLNMPAAMRERRTVGAGNYKLFRWIKRRGIVAIDAIDARLPSVRTLVPQTDTPRNHL